MWQARSSPWRLLGMLIPSFLLAVLGVLAILDGDVIFGFVGLLGIVAFATACSLVIGRMRRSRRIEIEVSEDGLCWRAWSDDVIAWHEIRHAEVRRQGPMRHLCLWLNREPEFRSHFATYGAAKSKTMGYGDVAINTIGTDRRFDDLVDTVRRYVTVG